MTLRNSPWDFLGSPVAKTLCSQSRGPGSIPGQGTRSHMLRLQVLCAATKIQCSQINILKKETHLQQGRDRRTNKDSTWDSNILYTCILYAWYVHVLIHYFANVLIIQKNSLFPFIYWGGFITSNPERMCLIKEISLAENTVWVLH